MLSLTARFPLSSWGVEWVRPAQTRRVIEYRSFVDEILGWELGKIRQR